MPKSPAVHRYTIRMFVGALVYLVTVFLTFHVFFHGKLPFPAAVLAALVPSLPIVAILIIVGLYLKEEKDEFLREIYIKSLLWAIGGTLALTSFWSFLHLFSHGVPNLDGFFIFAMFWIFQALSSWPLRRYYGGHSE